MPAVEEENKKASVHSSGFRTFLTSAMGVCLFLFAWATSTKIYRFVWASLAGYDVGLGTDHLVTYQTTTQQLLDPSWVAILMALMQKAQTEIATVLDHYNNDHPACHPQDVTCVTTGRSDHY